MYDIISKKYEYLKPNGTISVECDVDAESYILRASLNKFLKETIEIQPLEQERQHFLKYIENLKNSENSKSTNSVESFGIVH